jgi:hypothetical protein
MVTTRSASKCLLEAVEAAPLPLANEPSQKRSKTARVQKQRSCAVTPQTEQPVLSGVSTKVSSKKRSAATKSSLTVASSSTRRPASKAKKQSDKHESQSVCAPARSAARKKQVDKSYDEQKTQAARHVPHSATKMSPAVCTPRRSGSLTNEQVPLPVPACFPIVPAASETTSLAGSNGTTLRSNTLLTSPTQVFETLVSDDVEEQFEHDDDEKVVVDEDIQQNQEQKRERALLNVLSTCSIAFFLMGALIVLACAYGWWFGRFSTSLQKWFGRSTTSVQQGFDRFSASAQQGFDRFSTSAQQGFGRFSTSLQQWVGRFSASPLEWFDRFSAPPQQATQYVTSPRLSPSPSSSNSQFWMFMVNTLRFTWGSAVNAFPIVRYVSVSAIKVWWGLFEGHAEYGVVCGEGHSVRVVRLQGFHKSVVALFQSNAKYGVVCGCHSDRLVHLYVWLQVVAGYF